MKTRSILITMALGILMMSGCQQVNDMVNKQANSNTANTNANSNTTANSNANANTSASPTNSADNSNTPASNTAANTATAPKEEVPLTQEAKVFKNNLVGEWKTTDGTQVWNFTEDKIETRYVNGGGYNGLTYRIVDEKTIEYNGDRKAKITFEDNGNTLTWNGGGNFKLKRVNPK